MCHSRRGFGWLQDRIGSRCRQTKPRASPPSPSAPKKKKKKKAPGEAATDDQDDDDDYEDATTMLFDKPTMLDGVPIPPPPSPELPQPSALSTAGTTTASPSMQAELIAPPATAAPSPAASRSEPAAMPLRQEDIQTRKPSHVMFGAPNDSRPLASTPPEMLEDAAEP